MCASRASSAGVSILLHAVHDASDSAAAAGDLYMDDCASLVQVLLE